MGIAQFYTATGRLQTALELREQLLALAQRQQDSTLRLHAHQGLGAVLVWRGEIVQARLHLEQAIGLYDEQPSRFPASARSAGVPGVGGRRLASLALWLLGYPVQALQRSNEALALAQELAHPFSLAWALSHAGLLHLFRREGQAMRERAEATIALSRAQGFPGLEAIGTLERGWVLAEQGQEVEGLAQMRQGLTAWQSLGQVLAVPHS